MYEYSCMGCYKLSYAHACIMYMIIYSGDACMHSMIHIYTYVANYSIKYYTHNICICSYQCTVSHNMYAYT